MARPNKVWFRRDTGWWMVTINGRKVRLAEGRKNRKAAEQRFLELKANECELPDMPAAFCVAEVIDAFLTWAKTNRTRETVRNYLWYGQKFAEYTGDIPAIDLRPHHVTAWVAKHKWNASTEHNARRSVFRAFSWAVEEGLLRSNPLQGMRCPMTLARQRGMTDDEFRQLLRGSRRDFKQLLFMLRVTGCRPKEARELTWGQVQGDRIVLHKHKTNHSSRRARVIYLPRTVVRMLHIIRSTRPAWEEECDRVFLNSKGQPWTVEAMRLRMRRLKLKFRMASDLSIYHARHAFGTSAVVQGVDPLTVAELMGHRSLAMVHRFYVHLGSNTQHLARAAELTAANVGGAKPRRGESGQET
jgi:integrase